MHFQYAAEYVVKMWESNSLRIATNSDEVEEIIAAHKKAEKNADAGILADIVEDQVLDLAYKAARDSSNETMVSIIDNMKQAQTQKYKKITRKQEIAVSRFLLETFGSIASVLCAAFGKTNEELFGKIELTDDEAAATQGQVVILTLGYVCIEQGDAFPVSKKLLDNWLLAGDIRVNPHDSPVSVELNGEKLWVTYSERKAHDLREVGAKVGIYQ